MAQNSPLCNSFEQEIGTKARPKLNMHFNIVKKASHSKKDLKAKIETPKKKVEKVEIHKQSGKFIAGAELFKYLMDIERKRKETAISVTKPAQVLKISKKKQPT